MKRLWGWGVGLALLAGCGGIAAPTVTPTVETPSPTQETIDIQELATILVGMLAHGNMSGASMRMEAEQTLTTCELTGISGYFSHPDRIGAVTREYIDKWMGTHPGGEAAQASAPMTVSQTVREPDGSASLAKSAAVIVTKDCEGA